MYYEAKTPKRKFRAYQYDGSGTRLWWPDWLTKLWEDSKVEITYNNVTKEYRLCYKMWHNEKTFDHRYVRKGDYICEPTTKGDVVSYTESFFLSQYKESV